MHPTFERLRARLFLASLLAVAASSCGSAGEAEKATNQDRPSERTIVVAGLIANDHGTADVSGTERVTVEVGDFFFGPTVLSGKAGQRLTVELENIGDFDHTFTVGSADVTLRPGGTGGAEVTFPESGALVFVCRFHEDSGMRGGLSVGGDLSAAPGGTQGERGGPGGYGGYGGP